jgi:hypothetical protein
MSDVVQERGDDEPVAGTLGLGKRGALQGVRLLCHELAEVGIGPAALEQSNDAIDDGGWGHRFA